MKHEKRRKKRVRRRRMGARDRRTNMDRRIGRESVEKRKTWRQ